MSPEQARGDHEVLDERSDVYSLCVMFHEFLTLRHYLEHAQTVTQALASVMNEPVPFATDVTSPHQPPVPADLAHYIRHGVAKEPAQRYRSVTEMLDRLQRVLDGHCPVECPATMMKRMGTEATHVIDRRPFVALGVAVSTALFALLGLALVVHGAVT
jgi:serine/threonine-protein kinase